MNRGVAVGSITLAVVAFLPFAGGRVRAGGEAPRALVDLLHDAGEYVVGYEQGFSLVVAAEDYVQRLRASPSGPVRQTRQLKSDVVFVRAPGTALSWWLLRDVFEVDGRAVRDRQGRLEKLLFANPGDGLERARAIADEGARFNLGHGFRNVNVPTLALALLHPDLQSRFSFERRGSATIEGRPFVEVAFREISTPTVVKGPDSHPDLPAAGRVWIDAAGRTIGRTELTLELHADGSLTRVFVATEYRPFQKLALWMPVEMRDRFHTELVGSRGRSGSVELVEGQASYGGFRRAGVTTEEDYRVPEVPTAPPP